MREHCHIIRYHNIIVIKIYDTDTEKDKKIIGTEFKAPKTILSNCEYI